MVVSPNVLKKKLKWAMLLSIITTTVMILILHPLPTGGSKKIGVLKQRTHRDAYQEFRKTHPTGKIILYWTSFFDYDFGDIEGLRRVNLDHFHADLETKSFASCPVNQCFTTNDRTLLNQTNALIFHSRDINIADLPSHRLPHQRWIFYNLEPPVFTTFDNNLFDKVNTMFNWTMTYRKDSDVYHPYSVDPFFQLRNVIPDSEQLRHKKRKVAWFVSNCYPTSQRSEYVNELNKHIEVDIFGKCGSNSCTDRPTCNHMLSTDYKFYLAFENSLCRDYVTEKFFNALVNDVVPIVYGGANYSSLISKDAFIDINDFKSPRELASYLNYLNSNATAYQSYFHWRRRPASWREVPYQRRSFCQLCQMLHDKSLPSQSYLDLHSWWYDQSCTTTLRRSRAHSLQPLNYLLVIPTLAIRF